MNSLHKCFTRTSQMLHNCFTTDYIIQNPFTTASHQIHTTFTSDYISIFDSQQLHITLCNLINVNSQHIFGNSHKICEFTTKIMWIHITMASQMLHNGFTYHSHQCIVNSQQLHRGFTVASQQHYEFTIASQVLHNAGMNSQNKKKLKYILFFCYEAIVNRMWIWCECNVKVLWPTLKLLHLDMVAVCLTVCPNAVIWA